MKIKILTTTFVLFFLISCKTSNNVTYFQVIEQKTSGSITEQNINYEAQICPDDQLSIVVSSIEPNAVAAFNITTPEPTYYLVDSQGCIDFPVLGKLKIVGKTRRELIDFLTEKISIYAKSPIVTIQIRNFKVSVLGEVNRPGSINIPNERVSVLDAIGLAGDLTIYGERSNVVIIRDNNGKKEFKRLDLTSSSIFESPFYYLKQNDVIYVEPNKARRGNSKYSQAAQYNISVASTIIGAVSVIASLTIALLIK